MEEVGRGLGKLTLLTKLDLYLRYCSGPVPGYCREARAGREDRGIEASGEALEAVYGGF